MSAFAGGMPSGNVRALNDCARHIREFSQQRPPKNFPASCERAAAITHISPGAKPPVHIDTSWIREDLEALNSVCADCATSREKCQSYRAGDLFMNPNENQDEEGKEASRQWLCAPGDMLCNVSSCEEALLELADTVEAVAAGEHQKPASDILVNKAEYAAKRILKRREFQAKQQEQWSLAQWEPYRKFMAWLDKHLRKIFPSMPDNAQSPVGAFIMRGGIVILALFLIGLLLALAVAYARRWKQEVEPEDDTPEPEQILTPAQYRSEAEELYRKGEYRAAIRSLFLSFLRALEQKGYVVFIKNKTNREYLNELRTRRPVGQGVETFTRIYEETWYGMKACSSDDYESARKAYEKSSGEVLS